MYPFSDEAPALQAAFCVLCTPHLSAEMVSLLWGQLFVLFVRCSIHLVLWWQLCVRYVINVIIPPRAHARCKARQDHVCHVFRCVAGEWYQYQARG